MNPDVIFFCIHLEIFWQGYFLTPQNKSTVADLYVNAEKLIADHYVYKALWWILYIYIYMPLAIPEYISSALETVGNIIDYIGNRE